jgi:hypothetical protein
MPPTGANAAALRPPSAALQPPSTPNTVASEKTQYMPTDRPRGIARADPGRALASRHGPCTPCPSSPLPGAGAVPTPSSDANPWKWADASLRSVMTLCDARPLQGPVAAPCAPCSLAHTVLRPARRPLGAPCTSCWHLCMGRQTLSRLEDGARCARARGQRQSAQHEQCLSTVRGARTPPAALASHSGSVQRTLLAPPEATRGSSKESLEAVGGALRSKRTYVFVYHSTIEKLVS